MDLWRALTSLQVPSMYVDMYTNIYLLFTVSAQRTGIGWAAKWKRLITANNNNGLVELKEIVLIYRMSTVLQQQQ